jgi:hypothetical protein
VGFGEGCFPRNVDEGRLFVLVEACLTVLQAERSQAVSEGSLGWRQGVEIVD